AIELVGEGNRHHADARDLLRFHLAKRAIEGFGTEKERTVQDDAVDRTLEDAGVDQPDEGLGDHFADAIEALIEPALFRQWAVRGEPRHDLTKPRIVFVADHQTLRQRVADLADAD